MTLKWISVKDKLPPVDEDVLLTGGIAIGIGFYMEKHRVLKEGFWSITNGRAEELYGVTHWMPLPELPNE